MTQFLRKSQFLRTTIIIMTRYDAIPEIVFQVLNALSAGSMGSIPVMAPAGGVAGTVTKVTLSGWPHTARPGDYVVVKKISCVGASAVTAT